MLDFKLTKVESVTKDYLDFYKKVQHATHAGLVAVGSELTKQLQKHIQTEVYNAYTPKSYERRVEFGGGIPIISAQNMDMQINKNMLTFTYEPSGKNSRYPASRYVDGDALISAIENSDYTWKGTDEIPKRPFWNAFVDEMVGANGQAEDVLVKTMNQTEPSLQVKKDGNIQPDGRDTISPQQSVVKDLASNWDDDDELPF